MIQTSPITIQPLQAEDLPACVQVLTQNELWKQYSITQERAEHMLNQALQEGASILVAKIDGQTTGFAWYSLHGAFHRSAYLRLIGVLPAWQGHHVGEALLKAAEDASAEHVQDMFLLVTHTNLSAQRFYQRMGYQQVGAIPDYVVKGITELIYQKRLFE